MSSGNTPATWTPDSTMQSCGATKKYNSANADSTCATSACSGSTDGDVTECCKTVQTCAEGFGDGGDQNCRSDLMTPPGPAMYDSTKASVKCQGSGSGDCDTVDIPTCCKPNPPQTCGDSSFASDASWCSSHGKVYNSANAASTCPNNPCEKPEAPDVAACCKSVGESMTNKHIQNNQTISTYPFLLT